MLLATLPFSITMHYCKKASSNSCSSEANCCCNSFENIDTKQSIENLVCPIDCCSYLSIISTPKEQFKNNPTDELKNLTGFITFRKPFSSYKAQQNIFLSNTIKTPPLLVKKSSIFNQCFIC